MYNIYIIFLGTKLRMYNIYKGQIKKYINDYQLRYRIFRNGVITIGSNQICTHKIQSSKFL